MKLTNAIVLTPPGFSLYRPKRFVYELPIELNQRIKVAITILKEESVDVSKIIRSKVATNQLKLEIINLKINYVSLSALRVLTYYTLMIY